MHLLPRYLPSGMPDSLPTAGFPGRTARYRTYRCAQVSKKDATAATNTDLAIRYLCHEGIEVHSSPIRGSSTIFHTETHIDWTEMGVKREPCRSNNALERPNFRPTTSLRLTTPMEAVTRTTLISLPAGRAQLASIAWVSDINALLIDGATV